ncbi:Y+L amino acid transporter [Neopestalotiopsis sp. 37M]|nr:Y+L amino acid transporter [Neopestalotiopsis sp. 37M]
METEQSGRDSQDEEDGFLLPEEATTTVDPLAPRADATKRLTFVNGIALVLGLQIGSGIFLTPSQVSRNVPSPGVGVLAWLLGGCLVWTAVCSFIELGTSIATNGGLQEYLRYCYGDYMGAFFSWTWVLVSRSATMALIAGVFAEYVCKSVFSDSAVPAFAVKVVALAGTWLITVMNWADIKAGATIANKFLVLKLVALSAIIISGIVVSILGQGKGTPTTERGWFGTDPSAPEYSFTEQVSRFVTALFAALYSYNGFESIGFVLGDVQDPVRNLPRILHTAMTIVVVGFSLTNISLYLVVPIDELRATNTPSLSFADAILGPVGRVIISLVVAASALGALNANVFATASLVVAASKRGYAPKILGNTHCSSEADEEQLLDALHKRVGKLISYPVSNFARITARTRWEKKVPVYAMTVNATLVSIYIVFGTLDSLISFVGITAYLFYMLAIAGIFIIRRNESDLAANSGRLRTGSWNPIIFVICSAFIVVRGVLSNPLDGVALCTLALVVFAIFKTRFTPPV